MNSVGYALLSWNEEGEFLLDGFMNEIYLGPKKNAYTNVRAMKFKLHKLRTVPLSL